MPMTKVAEEQFFWEDGVVRHGPTGATWRWSYPNSSSLDIRHNPGMSGSVLDNMDDYDEGDLRVVALRLLQRHQPRQS